MANTNVQTAAAEREVTSSVQFLTVTAIFVALTYIFTAFINVRLPIAANGGLIHLGNVPLFIGAIIFGKKTGAIAGGVGMGLFDLLSGWTLWAPFTFVIVALMGFTVGRLTEDEQHQNFKWYVIALIAACVIKVAGYYIAEVVIYGNPLAPVASIPGNRCKWISVNYDFCDIVTYDFDHTGCDKCDHIPFEVLVFFIFGKLSYSEAHQSNDHESKWSP